MKKPEISRRRFLQYSALSVGALSLNPTSGESAVEARAVEAGRLPHPQGGSNVISYIPHLNIPDGDLSMLKSPNVWVSTDDSKVKFETPLVDGKTYYPVARISNEGFAPVFNALVNFYVPGPRLIPLPAVYSAIVLVPIPALPSSGALPPDVFRRDMVLHQTVPVNIPAKGMVDVLCPAPWTVDVARGLRVQTRLALVQTFRVRIVVECFDPLTDPLSEVNPTKFNVNTDRHVAANEFLVRRFNFNLNPFLLPLP